MFVYELFCVVCRRDSFEKLKMQMNIYHLRSNSINITLQRHIHWNDNGVCAIPGVTLRIRTSEII